MLLEERIEFGNSIARNAIKFIAVAAATRARVSVVAES